MPHAMFIGSKMATMRRLAPAQYADEYSDDEDDDSVKQQGSDESPTTPRRPSAAHTMGPSLHLPNPISLGSFNLTAPRFTPEERKASAEVSKDGEKAEKPSLACVKAHLSHSIVDIAGSLLGFGAATTTRSRPILVLMCQPNSDPDQQCDPHPRCCRLLLR